MHIPPFNTFADLPTPHRRLGPTMRIRAGEESGQALVEFALVLPVLLLILFGVVQFGLAFNAAGNQTHLASELARYATVNEDPGGAEPLAKWGKKQAYTNYTNALNSEGKVCISFPNGTEIGDPVKVEVTSTTHWLPILELGSTQIKGTADMRLEATPTTYGPECS